MNGEMHKNRKKYSPRKRLLINLMYIVNESRTDEEGLATYRDLQRLTETYSVCVCHCVYVLCVSLHIWSVYLSVYLMCVLCCMSVSVYVYVRLCTCRNASYTHTHMCKLGPLLWIHK